VRKRQSLYPDKGEKFLLKFSIIIFIVLMGIQFIMLNNEVRFNLSIVDKLEGKTFTLDR
jgi:hypothetical protein